MKYQLHHGDCLAILPAIEDCSVDAIVTDPPAGIAFMGKAWDRDKGGKAEWIDWMFEVALQCRRVIKPGGHALVWAIPRTSHWTGSAWEDAGWQVRDKIYHVFGSGFPKSLDVSKAIDKAAGAERHVVGTKLDRPGYHLHGHNGGEAFGRGLSSSTSETRLASAIITAPATPEAKRWAGWGTALKPAAEEWWLFRKPLEGTVAANVLKHGTGAINVDGCRIPLNGDYKCGANGRPSQTGLGDNYDAEKANQHSEVGRWPANFTHDGSDEVTALLGDAARFFYSPKASKADRDEGCDGLPKTTKQSVAHGDKNHGTLPYTNEPRQMNPIPRSNHHPTVKPVDLMTYLCRLITPPGGTILDPFTGSGSTGKAAIIEDFKFIGIEREAEYIEIAKARLDAAVKYRSEFLF